MLKILERKKYEYEVKNIVLIKTESHNGRQNTEAICNNCAHAFKVKFLKYDYETIITCPNCGASETKRSYDKHIHVYRYNNASTTITMVKDIEYDADYFEMNLKSIKLSYKIDHDTENEIIKEQTMITYKVVFKKVKNSRGVERIKGFLYENDKEVKFLKASLDDIWYNTRNNYSALRKCGLSYSNSSVDLWNLFKFFRDKNEQIKYGLTMYDSARFSSIFSKMKESEEYATQVYLLIEKMKEGKVDLSSISFNDELPSTNKRFYEIRNLIKTNEAFNRFPTNQMTNLSNFFLEFDFSDEEIIKFKELADRQHFILQNIKLKNYTSGLKTLKKYNIPVEKFPKELEIYYRKAHYLENYISIQIKYIDPITSINLNNNKLSTLNQQDTIAYIIDNKWFDVLDMILTYRYCYKSGSFALSLKDFNIVIITKGSVNNEFTVFKAYKDGKEITEKQLMELLGGVQND